MTSAALTLADEYVIKFAGTVEDPDRYLGSIDRDELRDLFAAAYESGIEAAAKLMEENSACFARSGQQDIAWQLTAEARHIRELKR